MPKLTFNCLFYEKYNTSSNTILGASLKLEDCEILEINNTKYAYRKALVKLSPEKVIIMNETEEKVNERLQSMDIPQTTLVYGNKVNPKTKIDNPKIIKLKRVWVYGNKSLVRVK